MTRLKIAVAGNCQVSPLARWLQDSLPTSEVCSLTPYHLLNSSSEIDNWVQYACSADKVFMIPLRKDYFNFSGMSLDHMKALLGEKLFTYNNLHCEAFFPFWGYAKDSSGNTLAGLQGPYGDYQDFFAMALWRHPDRELFWVF